MPVKTWRNASYPPIDPSRPELSIKGQTVIITGAGTGIGQETALAFAAAGAPKIHILGRRADRLNETKDVVETAFPGTNVEVHVCSVSSEEDVRRAAERIGVWDVFVSNAGFLATPASIKDSQPSDWWEGFEVSGSQVRRMSFASESINCSSRNGMSGDTKDIREL